MVRSLVRVVLLAGLVALFTPAAGADDKKDAPALAGVWGLKGGEMKLEFADKDTLKLFPHGDPDVVAILCKYTAAKGGPVKARVTDLDGKGKEQVKNLVPVGLEFTFRWKADGAAATLDDVQGAQAQLLKSHLEGKYEKK